MNPFTLPINDSFLYEFREQQRVVKLQSEREIRNIPIYDRSPEVKIPAVSEFRKTFLPSLSPSKTPKFSLVSNRENLNDFIQRKREILHVKKSTENKKKNIEFLENLISDKDKNQKATLKELEDNFNRVEKYEESLMYETKKKVEVTELKVKERLDLQAECSRITESIEIMQVTYERKLEELKHLESLKKFVEEVTVQSMSNEGESVFLTQKDALFKAPGQILENIDLLESNNLFLVRQVQEAEAETDVLIGKTIQIEEQIFNKSQDLANGVKVLEKQKENVLTKIKNFSREEKEDFIIDEKTLEEIQKRLEEMIEIIGINSIDHLSPLEMLEIIENSLQEQLRRRELMDEDLVKRLEKEADKVRRTEKIEKIKEKEQKKRNEVNEMLQKRKNKIVKNVGRPTMKRSKLPEKVVQRESAKISQETLDRIEFLEENLINS